MVIYKTPKEIFPNFELDMISIRGAYTGASVDILDKMAVTEIEDNIKKILTASTPCQQLLALVDLQLF